MSSRRPEDARMPRLALYIYKTRMVLRLPLDQKIIYSLCFLYEELFCLKDFVVEVAVVDLKVPIEECPAVS